MRVALVCFVLAMGVSACAGESADDSRTVRQDGPRDEVEPEPGAPSPVGPEPAAPSGVEPEATAPQPSPGEPDAEPEPQPDTEPEPQPDTEPEPQPGTEPEPVADEDAGTPDASRDPITADRVDVVDAVDESEDAPLMDPTDAAFFWSRGIGNWFVDWADGDRGDAQSAEVDPPRAESTRAFRVTSGEVPVAVDLWAQLDHPLGRSVNLSDYAGVLFWARLSGSSDQLTVAFGTNGQFVNPEVDPAAFSSVMLAVGPEWERFVIWFDDLEIEDPSFSSFDFVVGLDGGEFDLWIDDLALVCKDACP